MAVFLEVTEAWAGALTALDDGWPHSYTRAQPGTRGIAVYSRLPFDHVEVVDPAAPAFLERPGGIHGVWHGSGGGLGHDGCGQVAARSAPVRASGGQVDSVVDRCAIR